MTLSVDDVRVGDVVATTDGERWTVTQVERDRDRITGEHVDGRVNRAKGRHLRFVTIVGYKGRKLPKGCEAFVKRPA